jgi:hypothetical protein
MSMNMIMSMSTTIIIITITVASSLVKMTAGSLMTVTRMMETGFNDKKRLLTS